MKIARTIRLLAVSMAAAGCILPQSLLAAAPQKPAISQKPVAPQKPVIQSSRAAKAKSMVLMRDVALQKGGTLLGQFVDPNGTPISGAAVSLLQNNRQLANTITDKQGKFTFTGIRGGIYQVVTADSNRLYRLWAAGTAPKSAGQVAQVVAGLPVMRAQHTMGRLGKWLTSPLGLTAVAATAVAVPVALHNSGRDSAE